METTEYSPNQNNLNSAFQRCISAAKEMNALNGPLFLIGQGPVPRLIHEISNIVAMVEQNLGKMGQEKGFDFSQTCALTTILIGKASLVNTLPVVSSPLATALRSLHGAIDSNIFEKEIPDQITLQPRINDCLDAATEAYAVIF